MPALSDTDYTDPDTLLSADDAAAGEDYHNLFKQFSILQRVRSAQANAIDALAAIAGLSNGVVAYNELVYTGQPTDTQTTTIDGLVFEMAVVATNVYVTAANVGVVVSTVDANGTYDNLTAALNATYGGVAGQHPVLLQGPATTTPALANSTKNLLAVHVPGGANDGSVFVFYADGPGGEKVEGAAPSMAFSETLSNASWRFANLNLSTGAGFAANTKQAHLKHVVTTADIALGTIDFPLDFTPASWSIHAQTSAGLNLPAPDVTITSDALSDGTKVLRVKIDNATGGIYVPLANTNVIMIDVYGAV